MDPTVTGLIKRFFLNYEMGVLHSVLYFVTVFGYKQLNYISMW